MHDGVRGKNPLWVCNGLRFEVVWRLSRAVRSLAGVISPFGAEIKPHVRWFSRDRACGQKCADAAEPSGSAEKGAVCPALRLFFGLDQGSLRHVEEPHSLNRWDSALTHFLLQFI